jgi:hypothetical protein
VIGNRAAKKAWETISDAGCSVVTHTSMNAMRELIEALESGQPHSADVRKKAGEWQVRMSSADRMLSLVAVNDPAAFGMSVNRHSKIANWKVSFMVPSREIVATGETFEASVQDLLKKIHEASDE